MNLSVIEWKTANKKMENVFCVIDKIDINKLNGFRDFENRIFILKSLITEYYYWTKRLIEELYLKENGECFINKDYLEGLKKCIKRLEYEVNKLCKIFNINNTNF